MYEFNCVTDDRFQWQLMDKCHGHNVFKTGEWMEFLRKACHVEPFVVAIYCKGDVIGYFVGEKIKKGISIVASPFEGCTTSFQGLNMLIEITPEERVKIYESLAVYLFRARQCLLFQVADWKMNIPDLEHSWLKYEPISGFTIDITQPEEVILGNFHTSTRKNVRKSERMGVIVRQAENLDKFIDDYYRQLTDVFGRQGLKPTYPKKRVEALIDAIYPTGNLLLLESVTAAGDTVATKLSIGKNDFASSWGQASYTASHSLFPNEALWFEALCYWKRAGMKEYELGGGGTYKTKYGGVPYVKPRIVAAKYEVLHKMKQLVKWNYYFTRKVLSGVRPKQAKG